MNYKTLTSEEAVLYSKYRNRIAEELLTYLDKLNKEVDRATREYRKEGGKSILSDEHIVDGSHITVCRNITASITHLSRLKPVKKIIVAFLVDIPENHINLLKDTPGDGNLEKFSLLIVKVLIENGKLRND